MNEASPSPNDAQPEQPPPIAGPAPVITLDKKKTVIGAVITIAVLAIVFVGIIPKFGSYSVAFDAITSMSPAWLLVLVASVLVMIFVFVLPYQAAIPKLKYWPAFVIRQTGFTISNAVPAGGALGLALQYAMLNSYSVPGTVATSGIAITSVWSVFITLVLPILGVLAALTTGTVQQAWVVAGIVGVLVIGAVVLIFWLILRSESSAQAVGRWTARAGAPLTRRMKSEPDISGSILRFRGEIVDVVKARWLWISVSNLLVSIAQFSVLYVSIRAVGGVEASSFTVFAGFAAFSISRLASMIPVTPGGLGTVDAALIGLLITFGLNRETAVASALVWRCATYIPQVLLGIGTFVWWRARQARTGGI